MSKKEPKEKMNAKRTIHYFWKALMQCKVRTTTVFTLTLLRSFVNTVVFPKGASEIIGQLSSGDYELGNYVGLLCLTVIPPAVNNLVISRIIDWLDWSMDAIGGKYLSILAFDAISNQSMTFHNNHFSGSLTSQANKLPNAFIRLKSSMIWEILPFTLSIFYSLVAAALVCLPYAGILAIFSFVYIGTAILIYIKTQKVDIELASAENKQTGQLADSATNIMSVKSYARENHEKKRFEKATDRTFRATIGCAKVSFFRNFTLNVFGIIALAASLILIILGHDLFNLSIADTVFLYSLTSSMLNNIWGINPILRTINRSFSDAKEMVEILDLPFIIDDKTDKVLKIKDSTINFDHISFTHDEQKETLFDDFSLTIPSGKRFGLVGISGSGKTTLTKLLLRFADVEKGSIYIDGHDIRDVTQKSLRENIAYVPQESSLFHRSVKENIAYGKPDATDEEVFEAAKLAHADDFIKQLPDGYETLVGERGVKLSGGQRQRIAIARAILKNAPILVLDEATSALDSESEAAIQKALENLMKNRTSIVIAHRLSTVANLDQIVVLEDGKIVEQGTHKELLKNHGEYEKLWSRQSGAFFETTD